VEADPRTSYQVKLVWEGIGERLEDATSLAKGWADWSCPKDLDESVWQEAVAPWPIEFVPGSLSALPEKRDGSVQGRFRFVEFTEAGFEATVLNVGQQSAWWNERFFSVLPDGEQTRIRTYLRHMVPNAAEAAREGFEYWYERPLLEAVRKLAALEEPGMVRFTVETVRETIYYGESPDERRPGGSYEGRNTYAFLYWYLP